jgi:arginine utilization protein RocB
VEEELARTLEGLSPSTDDRDRALALLQRILDLSGQAGPLVVTGFLPPFYPSRINRRETPEERAVIRLAEELIPLARELGKEYRIQEIFPGISDLSWLGFQGDPGDLEILGANMPGWGSLFRVPAEELSRMDIPAVNLGPFGYDSHRATERLEVSFSFEGTPEILRRAVARIGTLCREERERVAGTPQAKG